ncbi:hypothetical protein ACIOGX_16490 [Streptomyces sp. NPDC088147]|uniref:hypothetical protein n=1 Tax=Streptomyces sp. NPDC088147 TaxID=3365830 RepID=UPI003811A250
MRSSLHRTGRSARPLVRPTALGVGRSTVREALCATAVAVAHSAVLTDPFTAFPPARRR